MVRHHARGALAAWQFLTLLRLPGAPATTLTDLERALPFFPLVGLALGALLVAADLALAPFVARPLRDLLLLVLLALASGGLHLDGLIDTADGLFAPGGPAERLAAMHESRAGPRGAVAGLCLLLLAYAALASLPPQGRLPALLLAPAIGRWAIVYGYAAFPYARRSLGVSAALKRGAGLGALLAATVVVLAASLPLCWPLGPALLAWAWLVAAGAGLLALRRLGGMSGDLYGAVEQVVEVGVLAVAPLLGCQFLALVG